MAFEAAKRLRSEAAKRNIDAKMPRCIDAKSVTEINFVNSGDEHESIVGWGCYPNNEIDLDVKMRRCMGCFKKKSFDYFAAVLNYNQLDSFAVARNDDK